MSKGDLAARIGVSKQSLSRTLNHIEGQGGSWLRILAELDLELTVRPIDRSTSPERENE